VKGEPAIPTLSNKAQIYTFNAGDKSITSSSYTALFELGYAAVMAFEDKAIFFGGTPPSIGTLFTIYDARFLLMLHLIASSSCNMVHWM
jgi:hypothetical protein